VKYRFRLLLIEADFSQDFLASPNGAKLVHLQAILVNQILGSQHSRLVSSAKKSASSVWKRNAEVTCKHLSALAADADHALEVSVD
jgi:hypothetical protein